jgi:hypothetical protein
MIRHHKRYKITLKHRLWMNMLTRLPLIKLLYPSTVTNHQIWGRESQELIEAKAKWLSVMTNLTVETVIPIFTQTSRHNLTHIKLLKLVSNKINSYKKACLMNIISQTIYKDKSMPTLCYPYRCLRKLKR